ncbi:hypothetical protein GR205_06420 [Rhizobium leguminosarum]|uniref:ATP-binding protein n=1 Tax=Rhizobium ruizarguesonis TaxID=2081791 RepID=UPI0013DF903B|nr:ATP-binding protein [Rhizobium ruizarguesonis]NEJ27609.1 hypothetical protein [Rhizobium ruizarguesonis]
MKNLQDSVVEAIGRFLINNDSKSIWTWDYWTTDSGITAVSTLLGAVVGALVAGGIQAAVSYKEFIRNKNEADTNRLETRKAAAVKITTKVFTITNQLYSILSTLLRSLEDAHGSGNKHVALWQKMLPMSGLPLNPTRIDEDELTFLFTIGKSHVATELMVLSEKFYALVEAVRTFNQRRTELTDGLAASMAGALGTSMLTSDQYRTVAPRMYELEDLANQISEALLEDIEHAVDTVEKIGREFQTYFGIDTIPTATFPPVLEERLSRFRQLAADNGPPVQTVDPYASSFWRA